MLGETAAAEGAEEGEDLGDDDIAALGAVGDLHQVAPAQVLVLLVEDIRRAGINAEGALEVIACLALVELAHEQQVGELFNHRDGIRDAAGPESVPDLVHLGFKCACDHDA